MTNCIKERVSALGSLRTAAAVAGFCKHPEPVIPALRRLEAREEDFQSRLSTSKTSLQMRSHKTALPGAGIPCRIPNLKTLLFQAQVPGDDNTAATQESKKLPTADEAPQKNTAPTNSPSKTAPRGSVQHLPDLDVEKPEDSKEKSPVEAFPVQLDLTTNPQGDTLDVSFLYLGPEEKKLVVLPFPGTERRSTECPGPAEGTNPLILPP